MDDREPKKILELLQSEDINVEVARLEIADYILSDSLAIERKTGHDFITAITDNRLFEQLFRLKDTYDNPLLILEKLEPVFDERGMKISSIYGVMGYIGSRLNIPIIPTRNKKDTVILLKRLAIREQIKDDNPVLARRAPKNMSFDDRCQFLIEGLFQTGPKTAKILIDTFETPYEVFKAIIETPFTFTRTGKIKYIDGPLKDVKGVGIKFVMENKKLLLSDENIEFKKDFE